MKRDLELCRKILLAFEEAPGRLDYPEVSGYELPAIAYNTDRLVEAGYIAEQRQEFQTGGMLGRTIVGGKFRTLSWEGHEFLDAIRNEQVWQRTTDRSREVVGSNAVPFALLKELAVSVLKDLLVKVVVS